MANGACGFHGSHFADAAVVECAVRHGGRVMTLDSHCAIVARDGRIAVLPEHTAR